MKAKKWRKKDERKMEEHREWNTQKECVFVKINEVIKMEDSQKKTQKIENEKKKEKRKKLEETEKREHPPKKRSKKKKDILSNAERSKKIGDTRIEYKRDVRHKKNLKKHVRKSRVFEESQKMMSPFKNEGFFWFKKLKKQKMEMQKTTKKVQKKIILYPEGSKNGTRWDICSKKKKRRKHTEKGKKGMKNRSYKKIQRRRQTRGETQEEKKGAGRKEIEKKKKGGCSKRKRKNILFLKKKMQKRKNENIVCPKREDTFFSTKRFLA